MKIFKETPQYLIRLQIIKHPEPTQYITLCETTMEEVEIMCRKVIEAQKLSVFLKGKVTMINIRESLGKNGKSKNISFRGLSTQKTYDVIVTHLNKSRWELEFVTMHKEPNKTSE